MRAKPAVVNGDPRSLTNRKGKDGLSRWSGRSARTSPWIGWVLRVPFFTQRTWSAAPSKSNYPMPCADFSGTAAEPTAPIERWSS
jgi:hypothetical protein